MRELRGARFDIQDHLLREVLTDALGLPEGVSVHHVERNPRHFGVSWVVMLTDEGDTLPVIEEGFEAPQVYVTFEQTFDEDTGDKIRTRIEIDPDADATWVGEWRIVHEKSDQ